MTTNPPSQPRTAAAHGSRHDRPLAGNDRHDRSHSPDMSGEASRATVVLPAATTAPAPGKPLLDDADVACDAHLHIIDPRFPRIPDPGAPIPTRATLDDYLAARSHFGTGRAVIVQPKNFGTDNSCILDAVDRLGSAARGIAVLTPSVSDTELRELADQGVRGIRFSIWNPDNAVVGPDMIQPLAHKIADLGWHVQVHMSGDQILCHANLLANLPCPLVIDHMARLPPAQGTSHPAYPVVRRLLDAGNTWLKLSGPYLNTATPESSGYFDATRVAQTFARAAPQRLVWGSDWPHTTEQDNPPDDQRLGELLTAWIPHPAMLRRIRVENPAQLYGFS